MIKATLGGRPTGTTFRKCLNAVYAASTGKNVFFIVPKEKCKNIPIHYCMKIISPLSDGFIEFTLIQKILKFKSGGTIRFKTSLDRIDQETKGIRNCHVIYDL